MTSATTLRPTAVGSTTLTNVFVSRDPLEMFLYRQPKPYCDGQLLFSVDGRNLFELKVVAHNGNEAQHFIQFYDPHRGVHGQLLRDRDGILLDGLNYDELDAEHCFRLTSAVIHPLRHAIFLGEQEKTGRLLYVSALPGNPDSYRLYMGKPDFLHQLPIRRIRPEPDLGRIRLRTKTGNDLTWPLHPKLKGSPSPQWCGVNICQLEPIEFWIKETPKGEVSVTRK